MLPIRKNATLLLTAACGFFSYTVKNLNLLYTCSKNGATFRFLFAIRKKPTPSGSCLYVCFPAHY